jgi:hypothetical protein
MTLESPGDDTICEDFSPRAARRGCAVPEALGLRTFPFPAPRRWALL